MVQDYQTRLSGIRGIWYSSCSPPACLMVQMASPPKAPPLPDTPPNGGAVTTTTPTTIAHAPPPTPDSPRPSSPKPPLPPPTPLPPVPSPASPSSHPPLTPSPTPHHTTTPPHPPTTAETRLTTEDGSSEEEGDLPEGTFECTDESDGEAHRAEAQRRGTEGGEEMRTGEGSNERSANAQEQELQLDMRHLTIDGTYRWAATTLGCGTRAWIIERRQRGRYREWCMVAPSIHLAGQGIEGWGWYLLLKKSPQQLSEKGAGFFRRARGLPAC